MKKIFFILFAAMAFVQCRVKTGSGDLVSEQRNVKKFKAISVGGDFNVTLRQSANFKVNIEADDNIIDDIQTDVDDEKLHISFEDNIRFSNTTANVLIEAPEFVYIRGAASARIKSENNLSSGNKIKVDASSAANLQLSIDAPDANAEASSGSSIYLKGHTKNLDSEASSGAQLNTSELLAENVKAQASSGATLKLHASVQLNAQASSGASIAYRGNPTVSKQESSGGSISRMD